MFSCALLTKRAVFPATSIIFLAKTHIKNSRTAISVAGIFIFVFYLKNLILFAALVNRTCGNKVNLLKVTPLQLVLQKLTITLLQLFLSGSPTNERKKGSPKNESFLGRGGEWPIVAGKMRNILSAYKTILRRGRGEQSKR